MKKHLLLSLLLSSSFALPALAQSGMRNGLPPTRMDGFVYEAAGSADLIYGDEGVIDIPPYDSFTVPHRINSGIFGVRAAGLTTGHGSYLPDAWGGDEWTGNEWSQSGAGPTQPAAAPNIGAQPGNSNASGPQGANNASLPSGAPSASVPLSGANNNPLSVGAGSSSGF